MGPRICASSAKLAPTSTPSPKRLSTSAIRRCLTALGVISGGKYLFFLACLVAPLHPVKPNGREPLLVQVTKDAPLEKKEVDDVLGGPDAWKNAPKTDGETMISDCPLKQNATFKTAPVPILTGRVNRPLIPSFVQLIARHVNTTKLRTWKSRSGAQSSSVVQGDPGVLG